MRRVSVASFLAAALLAGTGGASWPVALMLVVAGLVSVVCALVVRDTFRDDLGSVSAPAGAHSRNAV